MFARKGHCGLTDLPPIEAQDPTHVGLGFEVAPGVFVFGSVENGAGTPVILGGLDNGF